MPADRLPLFPLGLVLLPGEPVPLHIFEPRYKEMVRVCLDEDRPFGIVRASEAALATVGTTARIHKVATRYADGRLDIIVAGEERFHLLAVHRDLPYLTGDVEPVEEEAAEEPGTARSRVVAQHMRLLELAGETVRLEVYDQADLVSFVVGRNAGLSLDDKQTLLELTDEAARLRFLAAHLEGLLARVQKAQTLSELARGDGHATGLPGIAPSDPDA
jgi:ATP-dependent Lon protease